LLWSLYRDKEEVVSVFVRFSCTKIRGQVLAGVVWDREAKKKATNSLYETTLDHKTATDSACPFYLNLHIHSGFLTLPPE
jgi:hypothetical protein